MVVVLPAPLGPSRPTMRPFSNEKLTPSTARKEPYNLLRFSTSRTLDDKPPESNPRRRRFSGWPRLGGGDRECQSLGAAKDAKRHRCADAVLGQPADEIIDPAHRQLTEGDDQVTLAQA